MMIIISYTITKWPKEPPPPWMLKQKDISNRKPEGGYEAITTILPLIMMTHGRETMAHGATMSQKDSEVMSWPREPRTGSTKQPKNFKKNQTAISCLLQRRVSQTSPGAQKVFLSQRDPNSSLAKKNIKRASRKAAADSICCLRRKLHVCLSLIIRHRSWQNLNLTLQLILHSQSQATAELWRVGLSTAASR